MGIKPYAGGLVVGKSSWPVFPSVCSEFANARFRGGRIARKRVSSFKKWVPAGGERKSGEWSGCSAGMPETANDPDRCRKLCFLATAQPVANGNHDDRGIVASHWRAQISVLAPAPSECPTQSSLRCRRHTEISLSGSMYLPCFNL
jgi:hypothetical protein